MSAEHTPEPWRVSAPVKGYIASVKGPDGIAAADIRETLEPGQGGANAAHIVACVNALAGMDPAAVGEALAAFESLIGYLNLMRLAVDPQLRKSIDEDPAPVRARAALAALRGDQS